MWTVTEVSVGAPDNDTVTPDPVTLTAFTAPSLVPLMAASTVVPGIAEAGDMALMIAGSVS